MNCPICESKQIKHIYRLCDNMKIMGSSFPEEPAYVAECEECGLVFTDSSFTQDDLLSYYKYGAMAPNYYEMFGKNDTEEYFEHLLELLSKYISEGSWILDVAGSWGEFAGYLMNSGYSNVVDLDPNEKCIESAAKNCIKTIQTDTSDLSMIEDESYDMVVLNHSLEHILDLKYAMIEIRRILKEEGSVFIEVPDVNGYEDEDTAPFNYLTYEHVVHFSMNDIQNLAALFGFELVEKGNYYKKVSNYPSIYAILKKGKNGGINYSDRAGKSIKRYIEKSKKDLLDFIDPLRRSGEALVLWGIGASTAVLLEAFSGCRVTMLVDRNLARQGLVFTIDGNDFEIKPPEAVGDGTIVILSIPYHDSIEKQIREMGFNNKIVALK